MDDAQRSRIASRKNLWLVSKNIAKCALESVHIAMINEDKLVRTAALMMAKAEYEYAYAIREIVEYMDDEMSREAILESKNIPNTLRDLFLKKE